MTKHRFVRLLASIALGLPGAAFAEEGKFTFTPFESSIYLQDGRFQVDNAPTFLQIYGKDARMLISINMKDGSIEYGEGYTPDAAARVFWEAMGSWRTRCGKNE